jgi:alkylhydroperoxidase family enzyme
MTKHLAKAFRLTASTTERFQIVARELSQRAISQTHDCRYCQGDEARPK